MVEFREALRAGFGDSQAVISPLGGSIQKLQTHANTTKSLKSSTVDPGGSFRVENPSI